MMDTTEVIAKLRSSRRALSELVVDSEPGVYAFFLKPGASLRCGPVCLGEAVYVGRSSNLAKRQLYVHFSSDNTGFSTLRRSIGALLKDCLDLRSAPRAPGSSETNYRNYCFQPEGEVRLTGWMHANLEIGVCPLPTGYEEIEEALISELQPPLCLKGWPNPIARPTKSLRKLCADEARGRRSA